MRHMCPEASVCVTSHLRYVLIGEGTCLKEVHPVRFGQLRTDTVWTVQQRMNHPQVFCSVVFFFYLTNT